MSNPVLDFLANKLYQEDARRENGVGGVRWWCLREDLQEKYRAKALELSSSWNTEEESTAKRNHEQFPLG